jgi:ribosome-associated heat shock protein Hsp15
MSEANSPCEPATQRLDKWLWVARFFKTRGLAAAAISGGKVQVGGERAKPSRHIGPGTALEIRRGPVQWRVVVRGLAGQRRPAREAALLYEETADSIAQREREAEQRRLDAGARRERLGKPSKRERRDATRLKSRGA